MCGIVGYIGKQNSVPVLLEGLRSLEYRGYDSSGIAVINKEGFSVIKTPGKIHGLTNLIKAKKLAGSHIGIAHTRWATHGAPTKINAHPHCDCKKQLCVVHNGIIENYLPLKKMLLREGHKIISQTDTEIIAHLIEHFFRADFKSAFLKAINRLEGSFALAAVSSSRPDTIFFARKGSPLVLGFGKGENFLASDVSAMIARTDKAFYLKDGQAGELSASSAKIFDFKAKAQRIRFEKILWDSESAQKSGYPHYMLKEIYEQPQVCKRLLGSGVKIEGKLKGALKRTKNIYIVACGTAYHAGMVGKYFIEKLAGMPVSTDFSSEFRYRSPLIEGDSIVIAISQSGETADTLAAVRQAKKNKAIVVAICNVAGSSLTRESDYVFYTYAGPEIGVASTKAYTAQILVLYLFGLQLAQIKRTQPQAIIRQYKDALSRICAQQEWILRHQVKKVSSIAERHHNFGCFLFLGRNVNYPSALEGALKLKEISYIPAEGYAAGEMKHGPIALIDEYRAVVCIAVDSVIYEKMISNIQEIMARKGKIVIIATEGNKEAKEYSNEIIYIPKTEEFLSPLLSVIPLQLFAYYVAVKRGCDVDQPRNLAKSVTVE